MVWPNLVLAKLGLAKLGLAKLGHSRGGWGPGGWGPEGWGGPKFRRRGFTRQAREPKNTTKIEKTSQREE